MYPANLTEAGEDGRVWVGMEKGAFFSPLHPSLTGGGSFGEASTRLLAKFVRLRPKIGALALLLQAILNNPAAHSRDALHFLQI